MATIHTHTHKQAQAHVHPLSHSLSLCHTLSLRGGYLLRHDGICGGGNAGSLLSPAARAHWLGRRAKGKRGGSRTEQNRSLLSARWWLRCYLWLGDEGSAFSLEGKKPRVEVRLYENRRRPQSSLQNGAWYNLTGRVQNVIFKNVDLYTTVSHWLDFVKECWFAWRQRTGLLCTN